MAAGTVPKTVVVVYKRINGVSTLTQVTNWFEWIERLRRAEQ